MEKTFAKGLTLLETLVAMGEPTSVTRLANALGLYKSNVHRLLRTLVAAGYVTQVEDGRYMPSLRLTEMGETAWATFDIAPLVAPALAAMAAETGFATALAQVERSALRVRAFARATAQDPAAPAAIPLPRAAQRLAEADGAAIVVDAPDEDERAGRVFVATLPDLRLPAPLALVLFAPDGSEVGERRDLARGLAERLSDALTGGGAPLSGRIEVST